MILVAGAAGASGLPVLRALQRAGAPTAALSHSDAGATRLRAAGVADVRRADLDDPQSLGEAFAGAAAVYVIPPGLHPREDVLVANALAAARAAGARRIVLQSVLHPHTPALRNHLRKASAELAVRESGLEWTILQPSMFAQVALALFGTPCEGVVRAPFDADAPLAVLDLEDLARVATTVLLEDGHHAASYELAGPTTNVRRMAAAAAALRGEPVLVERIPVTAAPLPPAVAADPLAAADMISTFAYYDGHGFPGNPRVLELLLGGPATPFAAVAARELGPTRG